MKKFLSLILALTMVFALTACGSKEGTEQGDASSDKVYTLKMAGVDAEGLPSSNAMAWLAEQVNERTDGKVVIKTYPNCQLGEQKLLYEGVMDGSIDMFFGYLDPTYDAVYGLTDIPFLASNYDQIAYIVSDESQIYQAYKEHAPGIDMEFLGFFVNGVNGVFSTKDMGDYLNPNAKKDCVIRIANSPLYRMAIEALGFSTVTIPYSDTYTSLQTGIMDGMTGIPSYMVDQSFGDLAKYYCAYDLFMETNVIMMSPSTVQKLPDEYMQIIRDVCKEVTENSVKEVETNVNDGIAALEARGVNILPISDAQRAELAVEVREKIWPEVTEYFGADLVALAEADIEAASKK